MRAVFSLDRPWPTNSGVGFVPIRKRGKLPFKTEIAKYSLEYGEAEMEMHIDAMAAGRKSGAGG